MSNKLLSQRAFEEHLRLAVGSVINRERQQTALMERPAGEPWKLPPVLPGQDERYIEVAKAIGLDSPPVLEPQLERFFVARGWLIYPYPKVWDYLMQLAQIEEARRFQSLDRFVYAPRILAVWRPLRSSDTFKGGPSSHAVYDKAVPLHALEKVLALEAEFGKASLVFCVSDYEAKVPDPFLLVMARGGTSQYVIDVWDEPSFR